MKKWLLHIMWVSVLGMLTASCSQEADDPTLAADKEKVMVRFTIALDEPKAASRSWEGYDEDDDTAKDDEQLGSVDENKINTVHALLYDLNGVLMGKLNNVTVDVDDTSANKHVYTVVGSIEVNADQIADMDFKLMVLANCDLPNNLNDIPEHTFDNPNTTTGAGIPMWGIATYNDVNLTGCTDVTSAYDLMANKNTPVYMLRSMAKIEVSLSQESIDAGYTLTSATLNKAMQNGIVMPKLRMPDATADASIKDLNATTALGIDEMFNPSTGDTQTNAAFTGSDNTYYIYVPEYDATTDTDALEITLGFGDGEEKSFKHGSYSDGAYQGAWDVVRNHYYKYEVSVKSGADLEVIITINPWNNRDVTYPNTPLT